MYLLLELEALRSSITLSSSVNIAPVKNRMVRVAFVGGYFSKCKIARVVKIRRNILASAYFSITLRRVTSWGEGGGTRVVGEKPRCCNSTGEISSTYFPITLADLDSNGIENILIVRLHG